MSGYGIASRASVAVWVFYAPNSSLFASRIASGFGVTASALASQPSPVARAVPKGLVLATVTRIDAVQTSADEFHTISVGGVDGGYGAGNEWACNAAADATPSLVGVASTGSVSCSVTPAADPGTDGIIVIVASFVSPSPSSTSVVLS